MIIYYIVILVNNFFPPILEGFPNVVFPHRHAVVWVWVDARERAPTDGVFWRLRVLIHHLRDFSNSIPPDDFSTRYICWWYLWHTAAVHRNTHAYTEEIISFWKIILYTFAFSTITINDNWFLNFVFTICLHNDLKLLTARVCRDKKIKICLYRQPLCAKFTRV